MILIILSLLCFNLSSALEPYSIEMNLSHTEGSGIGYRRGFTTLEGFAMAKDCDLYPFLDIRGHGFNDRRLSLNLGLGFRYATAADWVYGASFWYDMRQGNHRGFNRVGHCFHQVGFGLEALGPSLDFRFNFYQPVGMKDWNFTQIFFRDGAGIIPTYSFKKQSTFTCLNAEAGGTIGTGTFCQSIDWSLYFAAGPYMIKQHQNAQKWGANFRLKADLTEYWTLEVRTGYDQLYLGSMQATLYLHIPFYPKSTLKQRTDCLADPFRDKVTQPVERFLQIMPLRVKKL